MRILHAATHEAILLAPVHDDYNNVHFRLEVAHLDLHSIVLEHGSTCTRIATIAQLLQCTVRQDPNFYRGA